MRSFLPPCHAGKVKEEIGEILREIGEILRLIIGGGEFRGIFNDFFFAVGTINHKDNTLCNYVT